ncbi:MAG: fumarate hydratase [Candidatus Omnitrophica bacterium]|nr:fumarate hydratase [Candidatus Omnitrophota bacterium]MBU1524056.1 fumarate hydratase [Candidatus Omnitrophota bacterium]MBU2436103.1 fumarate hydratase [Candidatus Omnitrophota bacterium]
MERRIIEVGKITEAVRNLCQEANTQLPPDVIAKLKQASLKEESSLGKEVFSQLLENAEISSQSKIPLCQDTGLVVVFVELGQEINLIGGSFYDAINEGIRQGYKQGYLRNSVLSCPLERENTNDNTPAIIHTEITSGDKLKITIVPKGGGSENSSGMCMLTPADGIRGIKQFVLQQIESAGANPCPPIIVGIGIGGNFEKVAFLAKKALLREIGEPNKNRSYAELEEELLCEINNLGIGPQGLGGRITALAVHIEAYPCHIASLPVAVNIQCHASRHKEIIF